MRKAASFRMFHVVPPARGFLSTLNQLSFVDMNYLCFIALSRIIILLGEIVKEWGLVLMFDRNDC